MLNQYKLNKVVDQLFEEIHQNKYNPTELFSTLSEIFLDIRQELVSTSNDKMLQMIDSYIERYQVVRRYNYLNDIRAFLETSLTEIMNAVGNNNSSLRIIEKVKQHIKNHYKDNLSLSAVSDIFQMNSSYLSHLFKKETGQNYNEYVTQVKMEMAKMLLIEKPHMRIYEISDILGYSDAKYFNKNFKKIYGYSPGQYREKNKL